MTFRTTNKVWCKKMQIDVVEIYKIGVAVFGIIAFIIAAYKIYAKLDGRVSDLEKRVKEDEEIHRRDVKTLEEEIGYIKEESYIIIQGLQACLDGLIQLHCDGDVSTTKKLLDDYILKSAHRTEKK